MATEKGKTKAPAKSKAAKPAAAKAPAVEAAPAPQAPPPAPAAPPPAPKPIAAAPVAAPAAVGERKAHGFRRKMVGRVTSNKMDKTVVVEVIRNSRDAVYKKYVRQRERYKAHDPENAYRVGDRVEIQEHRPISRDKRWLVIRLVSRSVEE
jgi:small subunit ribosomal protein S17